MSLRNAGGAPIEREACWRLALSHLPLWRCLQRLLRVEPPLLARSLDPEALMEGWMKHGAFTWATTAEAPSSAAVTASSTDWTMTMMGMPASLIFLMGSL